MTSIRFSLLALALFAVSVQASNIFNNRPIVIDKHEIAAYTITSVGILAGLLFTFFGYRLFKPVLFVVGFAIAGGLTYLGLYYHTSVGLIVLIAAPILAGIIGGILLVVFSIVGIFMLGAILGFLILSVILSAKDGGLISNHIAIWVMMGAFPFAGGVIAVLIQKPLIIGATALGGSYAAVAGVDRFVKGGFSQVIPTLIANRFHEINADYKTYIEIGVCVLICVLGVIVQAKKTAKGYYHKHTSEKDGYSALSDDHY
eukprot:TRINITY_DN476_c0_g1_i1.p1 TRINITY_DN476_c0_g1~~TRINITY_DN476_c0_g1_i1.p1  ORF type:complete len:281 (+),score=51.59 TRINITY_DN476_c0_g1_i1:71-844(+)